MTTSVNSYASVAALPGSLRRAVIDLLYRLADDELVMGHRNSEWTGLGPILEEDIAFSSMAQDEIGHAQVYYQLLHELGEADADTLAFGRPVRAYRCAALTSHPRGDWAFSITRQFLYDAAETVRLAELELSAFVPLAQIARKIRGEEKYHLMHGRSWITRLGGANDESHQRMQAALVQVYPLAMGLFEPTEADEALAQACVCPREHELLTQWESAAAPALKAGGLSIPENVQPVYGGRVGRHPKELKDLLEGMQLVYSMDPNAKW